MRLTDIVNQLQLVLPTKTNLFSDKVTINSLTRSGSTVTAITDSAHGLQVGNFANITNAFAPNTITSLTRVGNVATAITAIDNDVTFPNGEPTVEITGTNESDYNGTKKIVAPPELIVTSITRTGTTMTVTTLEDHGFISNPNFNVVITGASPSSYNRRFVVNNVVSPKVFEAEITGAPPLPVTGGNIRVQADFNRFVFHFEVENEPTTPATGAPKLLNKQYIANGYNGYYEVTGAPDDTTFTYEITTTPESPAQPADGTTMAMDRGTRVAGVASIDRAIETYTQKNNNSSKIWAYVTLDGELTSKSRDVQDDSTATITDGSEYRIREIYRFSIYIMIPARDQLAGQQAIDSVQEIKAAIYASILNVKFDSGLTNPLIGSIVPVSNAFEGYVGAYYVHRFQFETQGEVTYQDGFNDQCTKAWRETNMKTLNERTPTIFDDNFTMDYTE